MPDYDFRCPNWHVQEVQLHMTEVNVAEVTCVICHKPMKRVFNPLAVTFKGSGFYKNDNRSKIDDHHLIKDTSNSSVISSSGDSTS